MQKTKFAERYEFTKPKDERNLWLEGMIKKKGLLEKDAEK